MKRLLETVKNRPSIFFFLAFVSSVFCGAEQFNAFAKKFGSFGKLFNTDYVNVLTNIAEWFKGRATDPKLMLAAILVVFLMILALSAICSVVFSGFSYLMYVQAYSNIHSSEKKTKKTSQLIKEGINKRFGGMMVFFLILIVTCVLLLVALLFSIMPLAMSIERVIGGDASSLLSMILIAVMTVVILFFAVVFYTMYMSYMLPGIIAFKKGAVRVSIKLVNSYSWYLIPRTLAFIIYNVAVYFILLALSYGVVSGVTALFVYLVNWVLRTVGVVVYTNYTFHTFIEMKDDLFSES